MKSRIVVVKSGYLLETLCIWSYALKCVKMLPVQTISREVVIDPSETIRQTLQKQR